MIDCKDIKLCSLELMKKIKHHKSINKVDEEKIVMLINVYIDKLIFNIASLCSLLCIKMGVRKILDSHISYLVFYINKHCNFKRVAKKSLARPARMGGGAFNTAAFFGVDESKHYRAENASGDIMNIDFANNLARPALGLQMTGGGCSKLNKIVRKKMAKIFKEFNIKISTKMLDIIIDKFNEILNDFAKKLTDMKKSELKYADFKKVVYKNKVMKNDI